MTKYKVSIYQIEEVSSETATGPASSQIDTEIFMSLEDENPKAKIAAALNKRTRGKGAKKEASKA